MNLSNTSVYSSGLIKLLLTLLLITCIFTLSQAQEFQPGYIFTNEGEKIEGQIQHKFIAKHGKKPDNSIVFRLREGLKKVEFDPYQIKAFVMAGDSFAIIQNFKVNFLASYKRDFVKVEVSGKLSLLLHHSTGTTDELGLRTYPVYAYFVKKANTVIRVNNSRDFYEELPKLLKETPKLAEDIKSKKYKFEDLRKIVELFNAALQ